MRDYKLKFSHLGIHVTDLARMTDFYSRVLGFPVTDHGLLHGTIPITFMSRSPEDHHQIALIAGRPDGATDSVINQISFELDSLQELQNLYRRLVAEGLIKEGETRHRTIMHGNAWAIYMHDPEGNQIECFVDSPWYIPQPCSTHIDLTRSTDDILAETKAYCERQPGFKPMEAWKDDMRRLIANHDLNS